MKTPTARILSVFIVALICTSFVPNQPAFTTYTVNLKTEKIRTYWKDDKGEKLKTLRNLNTYISTKGGKLLFAMNCGMYTPEHAPVGLYIEQGKTISRIKHCNTTKANFCLQPQGVFYITSEGKAGISTVSQFSPKGVHYATQSAPVLLQDGRINSSLTKNSVHRTIRNGIGVKKDGTVVMAISNDGVTFYELAEHFKSQGCTVAMFFDGAVSRAFNPEKGEMYGQVGRFGGMFGAMIAVMK